MKQNEMTTHSLQVVNHGRETISILQIVNDLSLLVGSRTEGLRHDAPSQWNAAFDQTSNGVENRRDIIGGTQINRDNNVVKIAANGW